MLTECVPGSRAAPPRCGCRFASPFLAGGVNLDAPGEGGGQVAELTPRQRQALCLATLTNREIAARLGISWHTVKNLLTDAYARLDVGDGSFAGKRTLALVLALRRGIVTLDEIEPPPQRLPVMEGVAWDQRRFAQVHTARWREIENVLSLVAQMDRPAE